MSSPSTPTVRHYRFCGPITGAAHEAYVLLGTEDVSFETELDTDYCIIVKVGNTGDMNQTGDFQLEVEIDGGGFNPVNATSSNFRSTASGDTEDATSTTERLGTSAETFITSVLDEVEGLIATNVNGHEEQEFYFAFNVRSAELSGGESVEFRLLSGGSTFPHNLTLDATVATTGETASGDGPVPAIEAAGTAKVNHVASGAATLAAIMAAGTALVIHGASGTPSITPVTASGTATVHRAASGTPSITAITASGAAEIPTGPVWKSIEYVSVSIVGTTEPVTVNLSKGQDETKCVPLFFTCRNTGTTIEDQHHDRMAQVEIIDNAGTAALKLSASARVTSETTIWQIYVVEFDAAINVQQIAVSDWLTDDVTNLVTITSVGALTEAFALYSYQFTSPPAPSDDDMRQIHVQTKFNSVTEIELERNGAANLGVINGTLYVVDCDDNEFTVEHVLINVGGNPEEATGTIASTVLADTFLVYSYDTAEPDDDMLNGIWVADLQNTTTVRVRRTNAGAAAFNSGHRIAVVECQDSQWDVQRNDALTLATATVTDTITGIDQLRSVINNLSCQGAPYSVGRNNSTLGTDIDDIRAAVDFSSDTLVRYRMRVATVTNSIVSYEVIQFAELSKEASGNGPVPAITAAGTALVHKVASGTPSIAPIEAAGTAVVVHVASGNPAITPVEAAGTALIPKVASGDGPLTAITASGNSTVHRAASGTPSITAITASGNATVHRAANGTPSITAIEAAGTAAIVTPASGDGPVPAVEAAGTSLVHRAASGTPSLTAITAAGTALVHRAASGGSSIPSIEAAGTAFIQLIHTASGDGPLTAIDASGNATVHRAASGNPSITPATASGSAKVVHVASGTPSIPVIEASGTATVHKAASGAATLAPVEGAGTGTVHKVASGSPVTPSVSASGSALRHVVGSGAASTPGLIAAGSATNHLSASGAANTPSIIAAASAIVGGIKILASDDLESRELILDLDSVELTLELDSSGEQGT